MKMLLVLLVVVGAVLADEDKYSSKYDGINLDEILANKRLLEPYANCVLEKGKCNAEGKELKAHLKDALQTGCSKCTDKQQEGVYKVIDHLIKSEPEMWKELVAKYDPEHKYRTKYEERAKAKGIVIPE